MADALTGLAYSNKTTDRFTVQFNNFIGDAPEKFNLYREVGASKIFCRDFPHNMFRIGSAKTKVFLTGLDVVGTVYYMSVVRSGQEGTLTKLTP